MQNTPYKSTCTRNTTAIQKNITAASSAPSTTEATLYYIANNVAKMKMMPNSPAYCSTYMTQASSSWDDSDLIERGGIFGEVCHQCMACLMVRCVQVCLMIRNLMLLCWS